MSDTRARITTTKPVNLKQLTTEVGYGLTADGNYDTNEPHDIVVADPDSPVTTKQLETAIDNHVMLTNAPSIDDKLAAIGVTVDELKIELAK